MDIPSLYSLFLQHPAVSTDTRKIIPGSIFFALKGEHFDGNRFALQALQSGASYAVVSDTTLTGHNLIHVENTLTALQLLANHHRRQFTIPVLAITGSNGKTTTKELLTTVLSGKYKVHATSGNLNNHIGVPLTLLGISSDIAMVVCEMGANHPGEIAALCQIAEPTHGLITNIGKAHLEGFGSIEGVKKAKGELFEYLGEHHCPGFVNTDDPRLRELGALLEEKITYGFNADADPQFLFAYVQTPGVTGFTLKDTRGLISFHSEMFGQYNASNMLAAYAVGKYFKVDQQVIVDKLTCFIPGANRSEVISYQDCIIVKDAYNANPSSMELAVKAFSNQYPQGWVVLGDMKEVGDESITAHQLIIDLLVTTTFERIHLVGNAFAQAYKMTGYSDSRFVNVENIQTLREAWKWNDCHGKALLLKGSRSMQLEHLLEA
jgi:UDP-N-acetylmuramoyl-tripeptide--D-alanyl-D-alanine ligase